MSRSQVCKKRQSLAMSGDGNVIAFSTPTGIVTYKFANSFWSVNGIIVKSGNLTYFSLNDDGTSLIFRAGDNFVYKYINNNWVEKLVHPSSGYVPVQGNKDHIVIGAISFGSNKLDKIYNYINEEYVEVLSGLQSQYSTSELFSNPSGTQFFRFDRDNTFNCLTIDDAETRYEYVDTQSKLYVSGDASFNESIDVSGIATFHNRVDICGNLYAQYPDDSIPSSAIIGGSTGVNPFEDTSFNSNVDICGNFYAQYPNSSIPPSAIIGGVLGEGSSFNPSTDDLSLNTSLSVNGDASLNSKLYVGSNAEFDGVITTTNDISFNGVTPISIPGTEHYRITSDFTNVALTAYNIQQANSVNYSIRFTNIINYDRFSYVNGDTIYYVKKNSNGTWSKDNASTETRGFNTTKYVFSPDGQYIIAWFENAWRSYKWDIGIFDATDNTEYDKSTDRLKIISNSDWDSNSEYIDLAISETSIEYNNDPLVVVATKKKRVRVYRLNTSSSTPSLSSVTTITPPNASTVNFNYPEQTPSFDISNLNNNYFGYPDSITTYRVAVSKNGKVIFISVKNIGVYIYRDLNYTTTIRGQHNSYGGAGLDTNKPMYVSDDGSIFALSCNYGDWTVHRYNETDDVWYQLGDPIDGDIRGMNGFGNMIIVKKSNTYKLHTFNFQTNVWEITSVLDQTHHTALNGIGDMIVYRGPSQIPADTNNSLVGILEASSYTTELLYSVNFKPSNLFVNGDVSINYNLSVGSNVDICGNLYAQYPDNSIPVSALDGSVGVDTESDLHLNAKFSVGQDASFNGRVDICGNLYAQYPDSSIPISALNGSVGIDTESDLSLNAKLSVGNDTSFNANVSVIGDLTIDGTLQVRETESVMNTVVNNYEVIITNDLSLNGGLSIDADASFNGKLFVEQDASFNGKLFVEQDASFNKKLFVEQDASFNNNVGIGGDTSFNSNITVLGDSSFNGRVDICGNFYAQYPNNSIPASAIIGGVSSGGGNQTVSNLAFGDGNKIIGVTDDVTFDDDDFALIKESDSVNPILDISANLYVSGDVSFNNGSVLIPTPLPTDISNNAVNIGYLEGMGYITASGLLRQFEP